MKRKRLILGGLIFVLLFSLLPTARARAEDPNLTGSWNGKHGTPVAGWDWDGDYGVRISVVDSSGNLVQGSVDFIQDMEAGNVVNAWFAETAFSLPKVKKNKLQYKNGGTIALREETPGYSYAFVHRSNLPRTVGTKSKAVNIQTVRDYFGDDDQLFDILKDMANHLGTAPYTIQDLQAMNYYVMIEPIAIIRVALDGEKLTLALTATEGALYDKKIGDYIFSAKIPSIPYNFLPFGMYLESTSLGIPAYTGQTSTRFPKITGNDTIISQMGVGLLKFTGGNSFNDSHVYLHRFLDVDWDGFYTPGTDTLINEPWPEMSDTSKAVQKDSKNSSGEIVSSYVYSGTVLSPNSFWDYCLNAPLNTASTDTKAMVEKIKTSGVVKKSVTQGSKVYSVSSAYGSEKAPEAQNGAATLDGNLLQGKRGEDTNYWKLEHKVTAEKGKKVEYHFYVGYVNTTDPVKVILHYVDTKGKDLAPKIEEKAKLTTLIKPAELFGEAAIKEELEAGGKTYILMDAYYEQNGEMTEKPEAQDVQAFCKSKIKVDGILDVYLVYDKAKACIARLHYQTESGTALKAYVKSDVAFYSGQKVKGTQLFPEELKKENYEKITSSKGKDYVLVGAYYKMDGTGEKFEVDGSGDTEAILKKMPSGFAKGVAVTTSIDYFLVYKEDTGGKPTITVKFEDEDGNELKKSASRTVDPGKYTISELAPKTFKDDKHKTLEVDGKKYELTRAKYQFAGGKVVKNGKTNLDTFLAKKLDVQKDLTYTLIYKRDDSTVSVKLYFVDEDGEEIKKPTKQSVTVESGTDNKPTELFPDDLKKGEYEELKVGGSTYELSGAKYTANGKTKNATSAAKVPSFLGTKYFMDTDYEFFVIYKGKAEEKEQPTITIHFVDEDRNEIKTPTKKKATVTKGDEKSFKQLFPTDLKEDGYNTVEKDGTEYSLLRAEYVTGGKTTKCDTPDEVPDFVKKKITFKSDYDLYIVYTDGNPEDTPGKVAVKKVIILVDKDGDEIDQIKDTVYSGAKSNTSQVVKVDTPYKDDDGTEYKLLASWIDEEENLWKTAAGGGNKTDATVAKRSVKKNKTTTVYFKFQLDGDNPQVIFKFVDEGGNPIKDPEEKTAKPGDAGKEKTPEDFDVDVPEEMEDPSDPSKKLTITQVVVEPVKGVMECILPDSPTNDVKNPKFEVDPVKVVVTFYYGKGKEEPPKETAADVSGSGMEAGFHGVLLADKRDNEEYEVIEGAIPSNEPMYFNMFCNNFLWQLGTTYKSGTCSYVAKHTYNYTYSTRYHYYIPTEWGSSGPYHVSTGTHSGTLTTTATTTRDWDFYYVNQYDVYKIQRTDLAYDCLPGGKDGMTPKGYTPPTASCTLYGADKKEHLKHPTAAGWTFTDSGNGGTFEKTESKGNLGTFCSSCGQSPNAKIAQIQTASQQKANAAMSGLGQIERWNDKVESSFGLILSDAHTTSNVTAPDTSPLQSNQKEIDKDVLLKEGIVVPMKTKNEVYPCKEATVTYENVTVESGSGGTRTAGEAILKKTPDTPLNNVRVFTPVYTEVKMTRNQNDYVQASEFQSGTDYAIAGKSFVLTLSHSGMHVKQDKGAYRNYEDRDYTKYILEKETSPGPGRIAQFTCPIYYNDVLYPAKAYIRVKPGNNIFTVPIWVETDKEYQYRFYTIAHNWEPQGGEVVPSEVSLKYNKELSQYAAIYDGKFTVVGAVTDFTLFDVTDYPRYQNLFRKADGKTLTGNVFQPGTIKGYSVPYTFGSSKEDNSAYGELPMVENLYDDKTRKGILKTGYGFRFAFNTIGSYQGDADAVEITPSFFFVPKGKENEERIPVDLYYTETIKNTTKKLVKVGSDVDVSNQKSVYVNDKMFGIPDALLRKTGTKLGLTGNALKEFLNRRLNLYYYGKIGLTSAVRMFPDAGEATIAGSSPTDYTLTAGAGAERINKSVQTWYGVYTLPTQVHACPKDYDLTAYDLINYREDFWLTDGYIVVNFEIKVFKDGKESIRYYEGTDPRGNMWAMENGTKDGVRTVEDMNGTVWQFQPGDVAVYYADKSSRDDYTSGGTH